MNFKELNAEIKGYNYPPNYMFDAETLEPYGVLEERVELMKANVPEIYEGGDSFLDIGCNKGFWMFHLKDRYTTLLGYELDPKQIEIARNIKILHQFHNTHFIVGTFADVPEDLKYDTVYVGGAHHHIFAEDIKLGKKPMDFIHRLKEMANKYLIIDGVMNYTDFAFQAIIKNNNYPEEIYKWYTLENIKKILDDEFEFVKSVYDGVGANSLHKGTGGRYATVFKRK
jgi:SAM-dependent methyltransferase